MNIVFARSVSYRFAWTAAAFLAVACTGCHHSPDATSATPNGEKADAESGEPAPAGGHAASEKKETGVSVRVASAENRNFVETVSGIGRCEAMPEKLASLTPAVEGQVQAILAKPGDAIHTGQPLVEFNKSVALADHAEKIAARDGLQASLKLLSAPPRPDEEQISRLAIEQTKVAVAKAQSQVDRLQPLQQRKEVSEQAFFEAQQALAAARAQQQTAEAQYNLLKRGPRAEAIAEAQAKIDAADKTAALSKAQLDLLTIHAPIDGVLDSLDCHPGQTVAAGTVVGQVVDIRKVYAAVWLPALTAHRVRAGQPGRAFVALAQSKRDDKTLGREPVGRGQVVFVGEVADPQTGNVPVRVEIDNAQHLLKIGETLEVAIEVGKPDMHLAVPAAAVNDTGDGPMISVVRKGKTVVLHPKVGTPAEGWIPVSATDLQEKEPVVIEGAYNLPEGTEVETVGGKDAQPDDST